MIFVPTASSTTFMIVLQQQIMKAVISRLAEFLATVEGPELVGQ